MERKSQAARAGQKEPKVGKGDIGEQEAVGEVVRNRGSTAGSEVDGRGNRGWNLRGRSGGGNVAVSVERSQVGAVVRAPAYGVLLGSAWRSSD
jgi:hypothetical protein